MRMRVYMRNDVKEKASQNIRGSVSVRKSRINCCHPKRITAVHERNGRLAFKREGCGRMQRGGDVEQGAEYKGGGRDRSREQGRQIQMARESPAAVALS